MKKVINLRLLVFVLCIVLVIFAFLNKGTIQNLITSNTNTTENKIRNLGVTNESDTADWNSDYVSEIIVDTSLTDNDGEIITTYVPIPSGYTVSDVEGETTIKEGLVIYEGTEKVSTDSDAKTTRNQYVWVPVSAEDVYWTDDDGNVYGIEYEFSETGRTASKIDNEPMLAEGIYDWYGYTYYEEYIYEDYYLDYYASDMETPIELEADMQKEFKEVIESIEIYGGFYIGRYEVGDGDLTNYSATGYNDTPVSMQVKVPYNNITWYQMYDLSKEFSGTNEAVNSCMMYGCLWDATLEYLVEVGNKTYTEIVSSTSWGNYYDATFSYKDISGVTATKNQESGTIIPTGSTEYTKACNIYDLAGNVLEWTQEAYSSTIQASYFRGGVYSYYGTYNPASYRFSYYPIYIDHSVGFRAILYLQS